MFKSNLHFFNSLKEIILEFPDVVDKFERKDIDCVNQFISWIKKCEEVLTSNNISDVSALAGIRSSILAPKYSDNKRSSTRKLQIQIALGSLNDTQNIVLRILKPLESKIEECRELIRQLLLIVSQTQLVRYDKEASFEYFIDEIWQLIKSNDQLKPGAVKLRTYLTITDIKLLIAEEINLEDFVCLKPDTNDDSE